MLKKICIIQPGQIGDIIICLPIAKKFADSGYKVYWPLWEHIFPHFTKGHISYVEFVKIDMSNWYNNIIQNCKQSSIEILDLSFNQPGTWENTNTKLFGKQTEHSFDVFKYNLAKIDISEKWKLSIQRIKEREDQLYERVYPKNKYILTHFQGSDCRKEIQLTNLNNCSVVEIVPYTDCIFDWLKLIERAEYLVLIDSAFANLVEQLNLPNKKIFIKRRCYTNTPLLKNSWKIIE